MDDNTVPQSAHHKISISSVFIITSFRKTANHFHSCKGMSDGGTAALYTPILKNVISPKTCGF